MAVVPAAAADTLAHIQRAAADQASQFDFPGGEAAQSAFLRLADMAQDGETTVRESESAADLQARCCVHVDPQVLAGEPCLAGTRLPAATVAAHAARFGVPEAMALFFLSREQVLVACWAAPHPGYADWLAAHRDAFHDARYDDIPDPY
jgi:uncharacterized protein (DUF433 family)